MAEPLDAYCIHQGPDTPCQQSKKGKPGIVKWVLLISGVAVHDCWSSYYHKDYAGATHALCCAHIDRELQGVTDNYKQRWARQFQKLLMSMYVTKNKLLAEGVTKAPSTMLKGFSNQYDKIVESGIRRNPIPKSKRQGKAMKGTAGVWWTGCRNSRPM